MTDTEQFRDLKNSVKLGDLPMTSGGSVLFLVPAYGTWSQAYTPPPYDLPSDLSTRDAWLRYSINLEVMWANAVSTAITKSASVKWDVESTIPLRAKRARELLLHADGGGGWVRFLAKHLRDFLTTSNGTFIEIERFGKGYGSRIKALHHLDSRRCTRTGDPESPVLYRDLKGREHELRYWQVLAFSDMPDPATEALEVGFCAGQRAWKTIVKLAQMERYVWESVSGRTPTDIHFVGNAQTRDIKDAARSAHFKADEQGYTTYMGAVIVNSLAKDSPVSLVTVPLKKMPEHFDPEKERKVSYLHYADAIGLDPQDLQPITNQALGAGAQSQVLAEKAKGQGLAAWRQDFTHQLSELVLDEATMFAFSELDWRDERVKAEVTQLRVETRAAQITSGEITVEEARQMAADAEDIPREFVPVDQTSGTTLSDSDKPLETDEASETVQPTIESPQTSQKATKQAPDELEAYQNELENLVQQVEAGEITADEFRASWVEATLASLLLLFLQGAGVDSEAELSEEALDELNQQREVALAAAERLADQVAAGVFTLEGEDGPTLNSRIDLWVFSALGLYTLGQLYNLADPPYVWLLGATENHCDTCRGQHNQVRRASEWRDLAKQGIRPQGAGLDCGGWRCDCGLYEVEVDEE